MTKTRVKRVLLTLFVFTSIVVTLILINKVALPKIEQEQNTNKSLSTAAKKVYNVETPNNETITNAIIPDETYNSAYTDYPIKKYMIHDNGNISVWTTNGKFCYGSNITLYGKSK